MEKDICPNCGKRTLEKIEIAPQEIYLITPGFEDWGCTNCGNAFFKKVLDKSANP